jgi:DNA sulfur modification protein DndD
MKISRIEFENFRNFRDRCRIDFPTDGSVTVIYGPNGVGKTTLHQLFQWIFYGEVHFNKTASNKMYNLDFEQQAGFHQVFSVFGKIDFEHPNSAGVIEYYRITREWRYRKEQFESKIIEQKLILTKTVDGKDIPLKDPASVIERILPSGLSQYFFFDGESMIADLNQKGKDSAKSLRKALYSIFGLDIYEQAIVHIGKTDSGKSTVLGKLYEELTDNCSSRDIIVARGNYNQALKKVEELEETIEKCKGYVERYRQEAQSLSEKIGNTPSREALERSRKKKKDTIKALESAIERESRAFGATAMAHYPYLLLSRVVEEAQLRIGLKVEDEKLLPGLKKELVLALLDEPVCLCGNPICEKERAALEALKRMFPPLSYKYIYDQFKRSATRWSATYDSEVLLKHLEAIFQYRDQIAALNEEIREIDESQKQGENVDALIAQRAKAENSMRYWNEELEKANRELGIWEPIKKNRKKKLDELIAAHNDNKGIEEYIAIMESVRQYYEDTLRDAAQRYSSKLGASIQALLKKMLTSTRQVSMTTKFELSVRDSFGDEAKSEGQFAVVSFAYIGGIFKLLSEISELADKEFPLVLDGPFSKLDVIQRQNVIDTIPTYAPQVILFSKDDINACFGENGVDNVWTIYSNDERNVSFVKQGYDPEVFIINGTDN